MTYSVRAVVVIYAILVNTHTHTQTDSFWPAILLSQPAELKTFVFIYGAAVMLIGSCRPCPSG